MKTDTLQFHGHPIVTVRDQDRVLVAMRPLIEAMGLDRKAQQDRIKRNPVLSTCGVIMTLQMPGDNQAREVFFLDLEYLNGWLFGIDANRVSPELRETVIDYQKHCYHVLYQHFHGRSETQHENYWFAKRPDWLAIRVLALQGLTAKAIAAQLGISAGRVGRAIRRMIEVGLIDPVKRITARFKAETAGRMVQLPLCLNWGVREVQP